MIQRRDNARIAPLARWDVPSPRPATERESGPKVWENSEPPSDLGSCVCLGSQVSTTVASS